MPAALDRAFSVRILVVLTLLIGALASSAQADRRFYLSAKWGSTDVEGNLGDTLDQLIDGDEDSKGFELGYRFIKFLGVQAGYHDFGNVPGFGSPCASGATNCPANLVPTVADTTAYSVALVPRLPLLGSLSVFGKVGFARWESELSAAFSDGESIEDFDDEDLIYGVGVRLGLIGPVSAFAEYEKIGDLIETISVGATLTF